MELVVIVIAAVTLFLIVKSRKRRIETDYAARERAAPDVDKTYMTTVPVVGTGYRDDEPETFARYAEANHAAIQLVALASIPNCLDLGCSASPLSLRITRR